MKGLEPYMRLIIDLMDASHLVAALFSLSPHSARVHPWHRLNNPFQNPQSNIR